MQVPVNICFRNWNFLKYGRIGKHPMQTLYTGYYWYYAHCIILTNCLLSCNGIIWKFQPISAFKNSVFVYCGKKHRCLVFIYIRIILLDEYNVLLASSSDPTCCTCGVVLLCSDSQTVAFLSLQCTLWQDTAAQSLAKHCSRASTFSVARQFLAFLQSMTPLSLVEGCEFTVRPWELAVK